MKHEAIRDTARKLRILADTAWDMGLKDTSTALHTAARELEAEAHEQRGECDWTDPQGSA